MNVDSEKDIFVLIDYERMRLFDVYLLKNVSECFETYNESWDARIRT